MAPTVLQTVFRRVFQRVFRRFAPALLVASLVAAVFVAAPADAATRTCSSPWGSLPKEAMTTDTSPSRIVNLRSGRHPCFDRLVVDLDGPAPGYTVQYVDELIEDGRGGVVPLRGGARLEVRVRRPAHDDNGNATYLPADRHEALAVGGYDTFRQVAFLGTFEGETQIGLGVRARLPFRVFTLAGPGTGSRLVIDVAHRWDPEPETPTKPDPTAGPTVKVFFSTGDGSDCGEVTGFFRDSTGVVAPIRYALDELVAGPTTAEETQGASSWFSSATAGSIRSINLRSNGLLIVDFADIRSTIPGASSSCGSEALLANLTATVFRFPVVERVRFEILGHCDLFYNWLQRDCTVIER